MNSFSFGDSPELADELLALVLSGKKRATAWAASEGDKGVTPGSRWFVLDGKGTKRAITETVNVRRMKFNEVDADFARREGEGDTTLENWRENHRNYFTRQGTFSENMEVYCEEFQLISVL